MSGSIQVLRITIVQAHASSCCTPGASPQCQCRCIRHSVFKSRIKCRPCLGACCSTVPQPLHCQAEASECLQKRCAYAAVRARGGPPVPIKNNLAMGRITHCHRALSCAVACTHRTRIVCTMTRHDNNMYSHRDPQANSHAK